VSGCLTRVGENGGSGSGTVADRPAGAEALDAEPSPGVSRVRFRELEKAGATASNAVPAVAGLRAPGGSGWVRPRGRGRRLRRAASSTVHLNAVERIPCRVRRRCAERELQAAAAGELRAGVWAGTLGRGGHAGRVLTRGPRGVLRGVKTFCSGAARRAASSRASRVIPMAAPPLPGVDRRRRRCRRRGHRPVVVPVAWVCAGLVSPPRDLRRRSRAPLSSGLPAQSRPSPGSGAMRCARRHRGPGRRLRGAGRRWQELRGAPDGGSSKLSPRGAC